MCMYTDDDMFHMMMILGCFTCNYFYIAKLWMSLVKAECLPQEKKEYKLLHDGVKSMSVMLYITTHVP